MTDVDALAKAVMAMYVIDWCPDNKSTRYVSIINIMQSIEIVFKNLNKMLGIYIPIRLNEVMYALHQTDKFEVVADGRKELFLRPKNLRDHVSYFLLNAQHIDLWDVFATAMNRIIATHSKPYVKDGCVCLPEPYMLRNAQGQIFGVEMGAGEKGSELPVW
jgi:hypothetical protein